VKTINYRDYEIQMWIIDTSKNYERPVIPVIPMITLIPVTDTSDVTMMYSKDKMHIKLPYFWVTSENCFKLIYTKKANNNNCLPPAIKGTTQRKYAKKVEPICNNDSVFQWHLE